jgi:predicted nucleic acid-binding protein
MAVLFWDASALAKRYIAELGTSTVNALFAGAPAHEMMSTPWSYAETYSILQRRHNSGAIDQPLFTTAVSALETEVVYGPVFSLLSIDDATVFASTTIMSRHNLNATDAAILTLLLDYSQTLPGGPSGCLLIAADRRLLRAAGAEGFSVLDPETVPAADVPALLTRL